MRNKMKDDQFRELLKIVQGKDVRGDEVKEVLEELLRGEFKDDIEETKFSIYLEDREDRSLADVKVKNGRVILWINPQNWENNSGFTKGGGLRALLRHELLHIALNEADDEDPVFKAEARRKGIDIWCV